MPTDDLMSRIGGAFDTALRLLRDPRGFFASLPREGGYEEPAIFAAVMLAAEGIVLAVLSILHLRPGGFFVSLLVAPLLGAIGLGIGAAILLFLSRALAGDATYESSFRIVAYGSVFVPITAIASVVPYLSILVNAYGFYVAILGVIAVNRVSEPKAWKVLGAIAGVLLLMNLVATITTRRVAPKLERWQQHLEKGTRELGKAAEEMRKQIERQQSGR